MSNYYFISYTWRRRGEDVQHYANALINAHPLDWLVDTMKHEEDHVLLSYNEISKEQYQAYQDLIN